MRMKVELQPMGTPNFVLLKGEPANRQEGLKEAVKWALKDIPANTLSDLCDEFRATVFQKAGKLDPKKL